MLRSGWTTRKGVTGMAWKSLLLLLLLFGTGIKVGWSQSYTQRVYANTQAKGNTGLCVLCDVLNPTNATDVTGSFLNTYSTITAGVSLLSATQYQDLIFPSGQLPNGSDGAIVKIGTGGILTAQLLGGIYVQAYNGNTAVGNRETANDALLGLLAAGNQAEVYLAPPNVPYDRVRVTIDAGLLGAAVNINVFAAYYNKPATGTLACDRPIDVLSGLSGNVGALGSVVNAPLAIDNNPATSASLNTVLSATGYAQVTAIFPGLSKNGDSVALILSNPASILTIQLLNALTIITYNGQTKVDSITGSSGLLYLALLSGGSGPQTVRFKPTAPFDHIQLRFGALVNALSSLNVHEILRYPPAPAANPALRTTCVGTPITLNVSNPDATLTYKWYDSTQTTVVQTGTSYSPPVNVAGSFRYYVSATRTNCTTESAKALVNVLVNNPSIATDVTVPPTTVSCTGDTVKITPTTTFIHHPVFRWYKDNNKTTAITDGLTEGAVKYFVAANGRLSVTGLASGTYNYFVSVEDSLHCANVAGTLATASVTVGAKPAAPVVVPVLSTTTGQTVTLTAADVPGANIFWYSDTTQAPIGTGPSFVVGPFTVPGVNIYFASVKLSGGCESFRVPVTVTVTGPVIPTSCNVPTSQATGTTLGCILCNVMDPTNDIDNDPNNFTRLNIPVGLLGGSVYQELIFPVLGAATDSLRLDLASPGGLADVGLLAGTVISVYNNTTLIRRDTIADVLTLRLLSGTRYTVTVPTGAPYNKVEIRMTGVANLLTSLDIYGVRAVSPNPALSVGGTTVCVGQRAVLTATPVSGTSVRWYADSTSTSILSNQPTYTTDTLRTAGTFKYYVQVVGANGCANPERVPVIVTVTATATAADITLADTTNSCINTNTVLAPTATGVTAPVFKWYKDANKTVAITNGLIEGAVKYAVDSTGKLTITGLTTGNYTYYVSVSGSNRCENVAGALKAAHVKITAAPNPPVLNQAYAVTTGLPLTLLATPVPGATIEWYIDTLQAPIATGNSLTLAPFSTPGIYTYYAGVRLPGGCVSARVPVVITVTGPVVPTSCNVPTSQLTGTTLGCILCSVTNPTNDIDNDPTNFTRLNIPVGLLGGSVYQQLIFPAPGAATDSIRLDLASPVGLADVSLLGGAVISVYNNTTLVSRDTIADLLTLRLLTGNRFTATVPTGAPYDRVEVRMTGVANLLTSLDIYGVRAVAPSPAVAAGGTTVCIGQRAVLTATPAAGTTVRWYADSTATTVLSTNNTYTTDTLKTAGIVKYYVQAVAANGCANPDRVPVIVNVTAGATAADITLADTTLSCLGTTTILAPTATGVTDPKFRWYKNANKTIPITNGLTEGNVKYALDSTGNLTITGLSAGNYTYYVSVSGTNRCENGPGALKAAHVKVTAAPNPPVLTQTYAVTTGQPLTLLATPVPGATIEWYTDTLLAPIATGNSITLPPFNSPGVYTYYAGVRGAGGCVSTRVPVVITVTGPVIPTNCNVPTSQLTGTTLGCILCSVTNPTNDIDNDPTNFTRLNIPVGLLGGSVYQQLIFPVKGAATDSIRLDLASPVGLADVSLLGGAVISVYNDSILVSRDTIADLLTLRLLTGNRFTATVPTGAPYDRVEVRMTGLANLLTSLDIYGVRAVGPNPAIASKEVTICAGQRAVLTTTPAAGTSIRWYADSTTTVILSTNSTYTTDTLKIAGTYKYYAQVVAANGCANPDRIPFTVFVTPTATAADINLADTTVACASKDAVLAPKATGVTAPVFKWYKDASKTVAITNGLTEGNVKYTLDSTGVLTVTGLTAGNYTYYVSVSGTNRCENAAGALKAAHVKVVTTPAAPIVTGDVIVNTGQQATLTATTVPGATIVWYNDINATTPLATGSPYVVGPFNNPGTYTYYAAASIAGACESPRVAVRVVVNGPVIPSQECNVPTSQESGTTLGCILCSVTNPNNSIDSIKTNFTRLNIPVGILGGSVYQRLIFPNRGAAGDSIRISFAAPGGLADVSLLGGVLLSVYNNNTLVKVDTLASLLTLRLLSGQQFAATIPATAAYDRVEVRLTGVLNLLNSIDIYGARVFYAHPAINTKDTTVCINNRATLRVTPAPGTTVRWYADSTSNIVLSTQTTYVTDTLKTAGKVTYYVAAVGGPANCPNPARVPVSVTVTPAPAVPGAPQTVNVCPGTDAVLAVANPVKGYRYNWYNVATGGTKLNSDSGFTYKVPAVSKDTTFYVEAVSSCGAVSPRQSFRLVMSAALTAPTVTPNPDTVYIGVQARLTATSPVANVTFKWFGSQNGTDSLFTGPTFIPPTSNTPGTATYWVEATLASGGTCKSIRVPATVVYIPFGGPQAVPCEGASSQTIGGGGLLILGNVYNPALAVDNDASTASSLVINLGALNAQVWQRAKFNGVSLPGDTVRVLVSNPSQVLSVGVLGGIQLTTYNGNTPGDSVLINNPLLKITLLSSQKQALLEFVPTKAFDAVELKLKSGILGALTEIDFNYAQRALVQPKVQAAQVTACAGGTATLNVQDPVAGVTYRWYTANGIYLAGKDGSSFTTGALNSDTSFFVEAFRNGCASKGRTKVDVKVAAKPAAPTVQAASVEVCTGSDAVLAVANPVKGYSYNWYNVATGGTKLNTDSGFTFKVVNVTAQAIYYVEAVNDSCNTISATRTAVTVKPAAALAPPTVTPAVDTVAVNQQPVFKATAASANAVFYWFASQTSTDTLFKGALFAAPASPAPGTVTYWVEAVLPGATICKSPRVPATAITIIPGQDPVPCEGATGQTIGGSGLLILGNVFNPQLAVDNNVNTASSLVINLGVLNASVWQKVTFNGISTPGDTVRVLLSAPAQVLSAAVLASIQLTTYNGNTPGDSILVSNPLLHLSLFPGSRRALLSFVPTKQFNAVELKLKSGVLGALNEVDFNYAQRVIAQPKVQTSNVSVCKGKRATLSVTNPVAGVVYSWYDSKGIHLLDSIAYQTPATLDSGIYNYTVRASRNNCVGAASAAAQVTVLGLPKAPIPASGNSTSTCLNTPVTLSVNAVPGVTFNWYTTATGGALLAGNTNSYTTPANLPVGSYTFYVEAVNANNCASDSARTKVGLRVDSAATAADINAADQSVCVGGTVVLTPTTTTIPNPVFKWYANPDRTGPITKGVSATGVLTIPGLAAGTYTYYVSVSNSGRCENAAGSLKAVKVTVNNPATAPDIVLADTTICAQGTVKLTATSTTVTNPVFKWYKEASLQTLLFTGATYTTPVITAKTSYYVTVEGDNRCANIAGNAKVVTVTVLNVPVPIIKASAISICVGDSAVLTVQNADNQYTYRWYNVPTGGTPIFTGTTYVVKGLTASADFYVEATAANCSSATRAKVSIGVGTAPVPILEANNVTVCQGGTAVLKVISSTNGITYRWYTTPTGGTPIFTGPIFTTPALNANTTYYVDATGDSANCGKPSARAAAKVNVVPVPPAPVLVSATVQVCKGQNATLAVSSPQAGATYQWYNTATGGTLLFTGPVYEVVAPDSTVSYYVQALINGGCPSASRTKATVNVISIPATPVVAASAAFVCQGGTVTLNIVNPVPGTTYRWYNAATGGTLLATGASYTTGPLNTSTDFYAEASNGNCSSTARAKVSIGVGQAPTPTLEANALTICNGTKATFRVTSATNGVTYKWYNTPTGGTPIFTGPVFTSDPLTASTDFYVEAVGNSGQCGDPSARVKASATVVSAPAAPQVVATALKTCAGTGITVAVKAPQAGITYEWYDQATGGNLLFTGAVYNVPVVTRNTTYYVQATVGAGCTSATRTGVSVTVDPAPPIPAVVADDVVTCIGGTATFTIQNPDPTFTYRWYDAPSNGTLLATGTAYTTAVLAKTTTYYLEAVNSAGCSSARKGIKATVVTTIDAPLADPLTICSGKTGVLSVKNRQTGVIYSWYTTPQGGTAVFKGADFTITPTTSAVYYVEASTSGGCVSASRTQVNVTVNPAPTAPAVAAATLDVCPGQTATLQVQNPDATLTYKWYTSPQGGTAIATGATYTTGAITANQMYYVEASNNNGCSSNTRTAVSVRVTPAPEAPVVTGNDAGVCPGKTATLTASSSTAGVIFRWYSSATATTPLFTGAVFVTPPINLNTTFYVEAATTGGCISTARTAVQVNLQQILATPVVTVDNTTATSVTFRWAPVAGAIRYEVTLNNGVSFIPPSSGPNGTTHTITGLQPNQQVSIRVRAIGTADCATSGLSNAVTGTSANPQGNNVFVPNLFSPNGDGVNDIHYVYSTAIAQLEFRIYNQWGQLVFTSKDIRQGWDGTMGGQKQPVGVYVYIVKATMQDGTVVTKKGNVTLLR
ncbi:Ig-like domain-containing protein [Chitinophaga nivalis]|uniref:Gliding motility-associated C-terminal domain-containing protein n=1 Tax=Chitinophaga nivalis TaxID=2991709 RepID=A0ABT3IVH0_9BACT|nr:gliding motility-associated C-terminal domain-containing protein [Chitinophaga nivalis]MCW3487690.1 gliding motility-associated C-terminal domain-containing protein [Chitinophaga nivalis]